MIQIVIVLCLSEDVIMAVISKPVNGAFVLKREKADEFFSKKRPTSADLIQRFNSNNKKKETSKRGVS